MIFGALVEAICFTRLAYPIADRKGIQVELAGFISLHSRLRITRFGEADSTSPTMDCKNHPVVLQYPAAVAQRPLDPVSASYFSTQDRKLFGEGM